MVLLGIVRNKEMVMKKYNNWGIDMGGLSMTDPEKYRKINYTLNDKGVHTDLLDVVETVPLEYVDGFADDGPTAEDAVNLSELKTALTAALATLKPREEHILRMRFGIGLDTDHTLEEVGRKFSVTRGRIRGIEAKALRKLKHASRSKKLVEFLEAA